MTSALRKGTVLLVAAFIVFYLMTDPHGLAGLARSAGSGGWHVLTHVFNALITFFDSFKK